VERSITQASPGQGTQPDRAGEPAASGQDDTVGEPDKRVRVAPFVWGMAVVVLCLVVFVFSNPNRQNPYIHFVWQAQAWLDGQTSIPIHVAPSAQSPGDSWYQDVQPILDANGNDTNRGILPFPPLPALVLLPFVALWHLFTNEQLLAAIFAALDVGLANWVLGYLPIRHRIRVLTSLFMGLGTVLWYAAAIGSTWFWAHIVAIGCLLAAIGCALSADREAAGPRPVADETAAARRLTWPGRWRSAATIVVLGALGGLLYWRAEAGSAAAAIAGLGVLIVIAAAVLAMAVSGGPGVLVPLILTIAIVGGVPAGLILGAQSSLALTVVDVVGLAVVVGLVGLARLRPQVVDDALAAFWAALGRPESRQLAAGLLFGLACTARLTIVFGFPFLILVGGGGSWLRRGLLAGAGAAVPLIVLLVYTYASTGHLFNPVYTYLYHQELAYTFLNYHADWSIEDLRYVPQNLMIMFFNTPLIMPSQYPWSTDLLCQAGQARGLFDPSCPIAVPNWVGNSIILTSPAYLLAPLAWRPIRGLQIDRVTAGATVAVVAIAFVNLMHFSQGWVQFGYRFSNDFAPFAILLVALGASRIGRLWPLVLLVAASIAINLWGTVWGVTLGW
jgi:hypothetical protein